MELLKKSLSHKEFKKTKKQAKEQIRNIFVVTSIAKNAVEDAYQTLSKDLSTKLRFAVPTVEKGRVVIARRPTDILSLLEQTASRDLYAQALVSAVAVTEGYLMNILSLILKAFPEKLGVADKADKKVDLSIILRSKDLEDVLEEVIFNQIHSAFYTSPAKYFQYIEQILSIAIPDDRKAAYGEVKATRDIYVHNGGIVNNIYLRKAGDLARSKEGELININERYFSDSIACMHGILNSVHAGLNKKYNKSKELDAYLAARSD